MNSVNQSMNGISAVVTIGVIHSDSLRGYLPSPNQDFRVAIMNLQKDSGINVRASYQSMRTETFPYESVTFGYSLFEVSHETIPKFEDGVLEARFGQSPQPKSRVSGSKSAVVELRDKVAVCDANWDGEICALDFDVSGEGYWLLLSENESCFKGRSDKTDDPRSFAQEVFEGFGRFGKVVMKSGDLPLELQQNSSSARAGTLSCSTHDEGRICNHQFHPGKACNVSGCFLAANKGGTRVVVTTNRSSGCEIQVTAEQP